MKKLILIISLGFVFGQLSAQTESIFNHYLTNPILINPGAAGFNDEYQLSAHARLQWTGFPDAPKTYMAMYNGPIGKTFGLGIGVLSEDAAQMTRLRLQLNYAFRFTIKKDWKFAFGFFTEWQNMDVDNAISAGTFYDAGDQTLEDFLNGRSQFDAAIGGYGSFRDDTYFGLTFNNLVKNRLAAIQVADNGSFFQYYTFNLGHKFYLDELNLTLEPSMLLRQIRDVPFMMDINLKAGFLDDQLITGLSYRSLGWLGILLGTKFNGFKLYYSYDLSFQRFQTFNTGSHEVSIALALKRKNKEVNKGY
ncbi:MAG: PorP/SprF family type IX secretion system membrane protein [Lewinellaceae bacterium]|nr:PorP/SprF family type IX secretion system membrane protein [Lewinella sp.]MCB9281443.1 PorP/SprF family type IX secretion system membrane protein [Lewinellaceae bacterium]